MTVKKLSNYNLFYNLITKSVKKSLVIIFFVLMILSMFFDFALIFIFNLFFASISKLDLINKKTESGSNILNIFNDFKVPDLFILLLLIIILRFLCFYLFNVIQNKIVINSTTYYFKNLLQFFLEVPEENYTIDEFKILNNLLLKDLRSFSQTYLLLLLDQILQFGLLSFFMFSIFYLTGSLTFFFIIFIILALLVITYFRKINIKLGGNLLISDSSLSDQILDTRKNRKTLFLNLNHKKFTQKKILNAFGSAVSNISKISILSVIPFKIIESLIFIFFGTLLIFINYGYVKIVDFTLFSLVLLRLIPVINRINTTTTKISNTQIIAEEINKFMFKHGNNEDIAEIKFKNEIQTKDLQLNLYEKGKFYVDDLDFQSRNNYFIYGTSGFGKTSLIDTLIGYKKKYNGKIFVDKIIFNEKMKLNNVIYLDQKATLMQGDIIENILVGEIFDQIKFNLIYTILELETIFGINYVDKKNLLSDKFKTSNLSGGEAQRVLLARALYNFENMLILDEATNALDKFNEIKIVKNILNYIKNKNGILIFVSHNLDLSSLFDKAIDIKNILKKVI